MPSSRVILISGGSRGLGQALVEHFFAAGDQVATFSRSKPSYLSALGSGAADRVHWEPADALNPDALQAFVKSVRKRFGRVDVLINNAGDVTEGMLTMSPPATLRRIIALNLESPVLLTRACAKLMLAQRGGVILNISSVNGLRGNAGVGVYSATKAALDGLTRSLARELGRAGIRVNSIAPGYFESALVATMTDEQKRRIARRTPLGRLARIPEVVAAVSFMASEAASFITGHTLPVDGGLTC